MKKENIILIGVIVLLFVSLYSQDSLLGGVQIGDATFQKASSTAYAITTGASVRILATSSADYRGAVTVDAVNCAPNSSLYLNLNGDRVAVANTGHAVFASSSKEFGSGNQPPVFGAVQAITAGGNCTALVTEWVEGN